jgi:hypothetical protein
MMQAKKINNFFPHYFLCGSLRRKSISWLHCILMSLLSWMRNYRFFVSLFWIIFCSAIFPFHNLSILHKIFPDFYLQVLFDIFWHERRIGFTNLSCGENWKFLQIFGNIEGMIFSVSRTIIPSQKPTFILPSNFPRNHTSCSYLILVSTYKWFRTGSYWKDFQWSNFQTFI